MVKNNTPWVILQKTIPILDISTYQINRVIYITIQYSNLGNNILCLI